MPLGGTKPSSAAQTLDTGSVLYQDLELVVPFNEGTGTPAVYSPTLTLSITGSGSPTWTTTSVGAARLYGDTNVYDTIGAYHTIVTDSVTICYVRVKSDSTLRSARTFAHQGEATVYGPFTDETIYWDCTPDAGLKRLTWPDYATSTNVEAWTFVAGPSGMAIYQDGVLESSSLDVPTFTSPTNIVEINQDSGHGVGGDKQAFVYFAVWAAEWDATQVATWYSNPWEMFVPEGPPPPPPSGPAGEPWILTVDDIDADPPLLVDLYPKSLKWFGDDIADGDELQISDQNGHVIFRHFATAADTGCEFEFPEGTVWHGVNLDSCPTGELYLYF